MVKEIVKDTFFLQIKSTDAEKADLQTAYDLLDTIKANADRCVGLAANMIGVSKRMLVALIGNEYVVMINPKISSRSKQVIEVSEGCLSLVGERAVKRYVSVEVEYYDMKFKKKHKLFKGFEAQIIQHEMDHFEGILI